jgi:transmembrane sensor
LHQSIGVRASSFAPIEHGVAAQVDLKKAVRIAATGRVTAPNPVNIAAVTAWQQRRLVFADSTLSEMAQELARYNRNEIIVRPR